ncbi:NAD(P)-binding domain-containing protein [Streptomyces asoensis]|uniref:NADPH-dependent F420 reductase n=1 Tax=Streptomyces asoensis TaxID=249586 RepID=UPI0033D60035
MTTAIIGTGNIGSVLAAELAAGGTDLLIAGNSDLKAQELASTLNGQARAVSVRDAIVEADIIVFAVWLDVSKKLIAEFRQELIGKIVVDPSNPIAPDGEGGFVKTIGENDSSGQQLAALLPSDAVLVKAFGSLGAESLSSARQRAPQRAVLFYAADDQKAGDRVAHLIRAAGFDPVSVGGLDQSIRMEVFGDLHEFGGLGGPVSREEALGKV